MRYGNEKLGSHKQLCNHRNLDRFHINAYLTIERNPGFIHKLKKYNKVNRDVKEESCLKKII